MHSATHPGAPTVWPVPLSVASRITGKERDTESGLDYFGARYYGSTMGRWLSPDWSSLPEPVPYADLSNPQSLNLYGYVNNNPMSHTDPDGHECFADGSCNFLRNPLPTTTSTGGMLVNATANTVSDLLSLDTVAHGAQAAGNSDNSTTDRAIGSAKVVGVAVLDTVGGEIAGKVGGKVIGELAGRVLGKGAGEAIEKTAQFADAKFAQQLEKQVAKDGIGSVQKSLSSLEKQLAEHEAKLPNAQYKSSIQREINTFKRQIDTAKQFLKEHKE